MLGKISTAQTVSGALNLLENSHYDLCFIDLNLTKEEFDGLQVIKAVSEKKFFAVALTSMDDKKSIQAAFNAGCQQYFTKNNFLENAESMARELLGRLVGKSDDDFFHKSFKTLDEDFFNRLSFFKTIDYNLETKILLLGPTGVGKSKLARMIHDYHVPDAPFIHINLSELPETLIESELFGHVKGSFTGALKDKEGLLSLANGGTLFLDEVGSIPLHLQIKLLKTIEDKTFYKVGGVKVESAKFRLITATCDDLATMIQDGRFRLDFYFRIKGFELTIPALKNRKADIIALFDFFNDESSKKIALNDEAEKLVESYPWPGNIRELHGLFTELLNHKSGLITRNELPDYITESKKESQTKLLNQEMIRFIEHQGLPELILKLEQEAIEYASDKCQGKINEIGRTLKISKSVLYRLTKTSQVSNESN